MSLKHLWIGVFGLAGVYARYALGDLAVRIIPAPFPAGTLAINVLGSFAIGVVYVLGVERAVLSPDLRVGIMVGLLGGFTTFSAYSLETITLAEDSELLSAALYLVASPLLGVAAAYGGLQAARWLVRAV